MRLATIDHSYGAVFWTITLWETYKKRHGIDGPVEIVDLPIKHGDFPWFFGM